MRLYLSALGSCVLAVMVGTGAMPAIATPAPIQSIAQAENTESATLRRQGRQQHYQGQTETALETLYQALELAQADENPADVAAAQLAITNVEYALENYDVARESVDAALRYYRQVGDPLGELTALKKLTVIQNREASNEVALANLREVLTLAESLNVPGQQGLVLHEIGIKNLEADRYSDALANFQRAYELLSNSSEYNSGIDEDLETVFLRPWTLSQIGVVQYQLDAAAAVGQDRAIATFNQVITLAQETTNPKAEIYGLRQLSALYGQDSNRQRQQVRQLLETGDYDAAQEQVEGAIASAKRSTDLINQALELGRTLVADDDLLDGLYADLPERYTSLSSAYETQANIYRTADNWVVAAEAMEQRLTTWQDLLEIIRQSGDEAATARYQAEVAQSNWGVSVYHHAAMQYPEAVSFAETALTISQEIGAPALEIVAFWSLSQSQNSLGETARQNQAYDQALFHLNQARSYAERMLTLSQQPLAQLAGTAGLPEYARIQTTDEQASYQESAVEMQLTIYNSLSDLYADQQQYAQALVHAQQTLAAAEQLGNSDHILTWMLDVANLHKFLDDYDAAIQIATEAETLANETANARQLLLAQLGLARYYDDLGNYPEALRYYNSVRSLAEAQGRDHLIATIIHNLGTIAILQGEYTKALQLSEEALTLIRQLRGNLTAPNALEVLGNHCPAWKNSGWPLETQRMRFYAEQLRQGCIENTWDLEAKILTSMGSVYDNQGRYGDAVHIYQQSLEIIRTHLQDVELESTLVSNIGVTYSNQGNYPLGLDFLTQALELESHTETLSSLSPTLTSIGIIYQAQGKYDLALDYHQQALQALQDAERQPEQLAVLNNLGILFSDQGDYAQAEQYYQSGLQLAQELNSPSDQAGQLLNLATLSNVRSEPSVALNYINQALEIYQTLGEKGEEAVSLRHRGAVYETQGEFAAALTDYEAALAITRALDKQDGTAYGLRSLGSVYEGLGQWDQAEMSYQQALEIFLEIESIEGQLTVYGALGSADFKQENYPQALEHYQQVLYLSRSMGTAGNEAVSLMRLGEIQYRLGNLSTAKALLSESLAIQQRIGNSIDLGLTFHGLALVAAAQDDTDAATDLFQQALAWHQQQGDRPHEARSLSDLGKLYADQDQPELATVFLKQAVNLYEDIREKNRVLEQDLQQSYTDTVADTYRQLADMLLSQGRIPEAPTSLRPVET